MKSKGELTAGWEKVPFAAANKKLCDAAKIAGLRVINPAED